LFLEGEWHWGVKRGQNRERAKKSLVNRLERDRTYYVFAAFWVLLLCFCCAAVADESLPGEGEREKQGVILQVLCL
jgi:hypothetical protein